MLNLKYKGHINQSRIYTDSVMTLLAYIRFYILSISLNLCLKISPSHLQPILHTRSTSNLVRWLDFYFTLILDFKVLLSFFKSAISLFIRMMLFSEHGIIIHHITYIENVIGGKKSSTEVGEILIVIFTPSSYSYSRSGQTRQNQEH